MILFITLFLLPLRAQLGEASGSQGNGQGTGKGDCKSVTVDENGLTELKIVQN